MSCPCYVHSRNEPFHFQVLGFVSLVVLEMRKSFICRIDVTALSYEQLVFSFAFAAWLRLSHVWKSQLRLQRICKDIFLLNLQIIHHWIILLFLTYYTTESSVTNFTTFKFHHIRYSKQKYGFSFIVVHIIRGSHKCNNDHSCNRVWPLMYAMKQDVHHHLWLLRWADFKECNQHFLWTLVTRTREGY